MSLEKSLGLKLNDTIFKPNISLFLGFLGYMCIVCYVILSFTYFPSVAGTYLRLKHMTYLMHSAFSAFILLSLFIVFIDQAKTISLVKLLFFLFVISFSISLINLFQPGDNNERVVELVGRLDNVSRLHNHYSLLGDERMPVSKCIGYHDGTYFNNKNVACVLSDATSCSAANNACVKDGSGAKLVDFYYASSLQSCMFPRLNGNYVSEEMLRNAIRGGARFVDMDIHLHLSDKGAFPVVKSDWGARTPLNHLNIEICFSVILQEAFSKNANEDPFFIHLNLKSYNLEMFDRLAETYIRMFPQENLPDSIYNYKNNGIGNSYNIATQQICSFYNKFILIVSGEFGVSALDEITNVHTGANDRIRSYTDVELPMNPEEEKAHNMAHFSIVLPSENMMNTNPGKSWSCGSQFFLMNYGSIDNVMNSHNNFFKKHACIMKSLELQGVRTPVGTTTPTGDDQPATTQPATTQPATTQPATTAPELKVRFIQLSFNEILQIELFLEPIGRKFKEKTINTNDTTYINTQLIFELNKHVNSLNTKYNDTVSDADLVAFNKLLSDLQSWETKEKTVLIQQIDNIRILLEVAATTKSQGSHSRDQFIINF